MGLIWLRLLVNPECMSMLCASVLVGQVLALQEGSAVGWMTKESSINVRQGKSFVSSSKQLLRPAQPPVQSVLRVKWLGLEANLLSLSCARGRICGAVCAVPPGKKFCVIFKASRQLLRPAQPPVQSVLRVKWLGLEANHLSLSCARGRICGAVCAVPPHSSVPSLWCLMKNGDNFTLCEVF
jgi:hypothetical protein